MGQLEQLLICHCTAMITLTQIGDPGAVPFDRDALLAVDERLPHCFVIGVLSYTPFAAEFFPLHLKLTLLVRQHA